MGGSRRRSRWAPASISTRRRTPTSTWASASPSAASTNDPSRGEREARGRSMARGLSAREIGRAALPALAFAALAVFYLWTLGRPSLWLDEGWGASYCVGIARAAWEHATSLSPGR